MKRVIDVNFEAADDPLTVTYDRNALVRAIADSAPLALLADRFSHIRMSASVDVLAEAIVSWNLVGNDGRPYPINRESFNQLPVFVLSTISQAIWADAFPAGE